MFTIKEITAAGTFGTVCVARDIRSGRDVALKVLKKEFIDSHKVLTRTRDEARILSMLDHPNIVKVHELLEVNGHPVVVMEWVQGTSLEDLLDTHPDGLPTAEALEIVRQSCSALDAAYNTMNRGGDRLGIIHRDIKPSNILLNVEGQVKVVDFGIAHGDFEEKEAVTVSMVLGTRQYSAPERLDGAIDDMSGDVYAMGLVLYELLTGRRPQLSMHPKNHAGNLQRFLDDLAVLQGDALDRLRALIQHMLEYEPEDRPTQGEAVAQLESLLADTGLVPDLEAFSARAVMPLFLGRGRKQPHSHPHWKHVHFLHEDEELPDLDTAEITAADAAVREHLAHAEWADDLEGLRTMLDANPGWTATPFVEILDQALVPVWMFWKKSYVPVQVLVTTLDVLRDRPTPAVVARAKKLEKHENRQVRNRARILAQKS